MIGVIAAVWFGYISKEQWNKGREKIKDVVGEVKDYELQLREDIEDVESTIKTKRKKDENIEATIKQDVITDNTDNDSVHK